MPPGGGVGGGSDAAMILNAVYPPLPLPGGELLPATAEVFHQYLPLSAPGGSGQGEGELRITYPRIEDPVNQINNKVRQHEIDSDQNRDSHQRLKVGKYG
jgi:hypothetical protein